MEEEAQLKLLEDPKQCCWWWWVQTRLRRWVCPHYELSSLKIETCTWCLLSSVLFFIIWGEVLAINSFSHTLKNPLQSLVVIYFGFFSFIFFLHFRSANDRRHFFCISFLSTLFEGQQQQQQQQQFLHHFKFNLNAHDFEIRIRGKHHSGAFFVACHSARCKTEINLDSIRYIMYIMWSIFSVNVKDVLFSLFLSIYRRIMIVSIRFFYYYKFFFFATSVQTVK